MLSKIIHALANYRVTLCLYGFVVAVLLSLLFVAQPIFAQTVTDTPTPTVTPTGSVAPTPDTTAQQNDLRNKINDYRSKIDSLQKEANTLSSQIKIADSQIALSELRVTETKEKIAQLEKDIAYAKDRINGIEDNISKSTKAMVNRTTSIYAVGTIDPFHVLLTSNTVQNFLTRLHYLQMIQLYDRRMVYAAEQQKNSYQDEQALFEAKQAEAEKLRGQLEEYNQQMESEKKQKETLLTQTKGSESNYQKLLAQAQAQLAGFTRFTQSQGGASLLSGQTQCDDWGCYYNQRDSQWGGLSLNGTQYSLASDGCLVTSMAMVYTHYGYKNVTPITINSNPGNFASYYPAFLLKRITADGASSDRISTDIDGTLASGHPVVVGISYDGGPYADHFVVFVSGSGGNYVMNDPYTPNGNKISFRDRYPSARIVEYEKVVF